MIYNLHNIKFIDIYDIISHIECNIINDCHNYNLLNKKLNSDFKRVFYFFIIKELCDIQCDSIEKVVFMYSKRVVHNLELYKYIDRVDMDQFIQSSIRKIKKMLPINLCLECLDDVDQLRYGDIKDIISRSVKDNSNHTFRDIKKFVDKYELTFFNKGFFDNVRIKSQIYK